MTALGLPNDIADGQAGDASKVQANFDAIKTYVNTTLPADRATAVAAAAATAIEAASEFVGVEVSRAASVAVVAEATSTVSFTAEVLDTDGYFTATSTNIVIPTDMGGLYVPSLKMSDPNPMTVTVWVNGTARQTFAFGFSSSYYTAMKPIHVADGDVVTLRVFNATSGTLSYTVTGFRLTRISA